jgi:hypothetical protein
MQINADRMSFVSKAYNYYDKIHLQKNISSAKN